MVDNGQISTEARKRRDFDLPINCDFLSRIGGATINAIQPIVVNI